ncbi:MAG: Abi family protein [Treponema sp.]|nr:Abi family protein [Treponema sp.]
MYSLLDLTQHLLDSHNIRVDQNQLTDLRNIGYYHGYKGYRFIREPQDRIEFKELREITALNRFDMDVKSLVYPKIMFIETALKNYFLECLLADSQSPNMSVIYEKSLTHYRSFDKGSHKYKEELSKLMNLQIRIKSALIRDYNAKRKVVEHFLNSDKPIPVWAVVETLTLGEFGTFFCCAKKEIRINTSKLLNLPTNLDADGNMISYMIYALRDLRNAVAHNGVVFDTRFKNSQVNGQLTALLEKELGITDLDFKFIDAYIILITYIYDKMSNGTKVCRSFLKEYDKFCESLCSVIQKDTYFRIVGSRHKGNLESLIKRYMPTSPDAEAKEVKKEEKNCRNCQL